MSFWNTITKPVNKVLDSTAFKVAMPVQALGQAAVKGVSGLAGINNGRGLAPADQYAIGAGTGAAIAGGAALAGGSAAPATAPAAGGTAPATAPASASSGTSGWENHASPMRYASQALASGGEAYTSSQKKQPQQGQAQLPPMPQFPTYPTTAPNPWGGQ